MFFQIGTDTLMLSLFSCTVCLALEEESSVILNTELDYKTGFRVNFWLKVEVLPAFIKLVYKIGLDVLNLHLNPGILTSKSPF